MDDISIQLSHPFSNTGLLLQKLLTSVFQTTHKKEFNFVPTTSEPKKIFEFSEDVENRYNCFLAINPLEPNYLYISNEEAEEISKMNLDTFKVDHVASISTPRGLAFNSKGELFVCSYSDCKIIKVTFDKVSKEWSPSVYFGEAGGSVLLDDHRSKATGNYAMSVCFDSMDNLYFTDASKHVRLIKDDQVYTIGGNNLDKKCRLTPGGKFITVRSFTYPWDIKVNPFNDKELLVGDIDGQSIYRINLSTFKSTKLVTTAESTQQMSVVGSWLYYCHSSAIIKRNLETGKEVILYQKPSGEDDSFSGLVADVNRNCLYCTDQHSVYIFK